MIEIEQYNEEVTCIKTATEHDENVIMWVYAYHINDSLIDAGCSNALEELRKYGKNNRIEQIYVTHPHEDHSGGLSAFSKDSTVFAHPSAFEILTNPPDLADFFKYIWGQPEAIEHVTKTPDRFPIGDLEFQVIDLSGHYQNMLGFYEESKGWLFSADAVPLPSRKYIAMPDENVPRMITTMERLLEMDITVLFDGHRGPITKPQEHIQKRVDYLKETQKKTLELHEQGKSIDEIIEVLGFEGPWYLELTKERFGIDFFVKSLIHDVP
ncbi:MAG: MBL fold metallo-hydrolase [Candidatus Thorarchaeota archaeon]